MDSSDFKTIKQRTSYILESVPDARNNDNLLLSIYWQLYDDIKSTGDIAKGTRADSIMRSKRYLCSTPNTEEEAI